ncbi:hypothetical protein B0H17DRAFT_1153098 [Mycena rosella]|uniref:Uncharacterized protein n=1 Tax=Mycena rosella TaxID=1033263 RepID=A0AAD7FBB8_MYCRO|nr:hypothetical protein B0H17DRAFT_1153098 [Mycena rosella]
MSHWQGLGATSYDLEDRYYRLRGVTGVQHFTPSSRRLGIWTGDAAGKVNTVGNLWGWILVVHRRVKPESPSQTVISAYGPQCGSAITSELLWKARAPRSETNDGIDYGMMAAHQLDRAQDKTAHISSRMQRFRGTIIPRFRGQEEEKCVTGNWG